MMFSTSLPAAEPVSSDSATNTNATPRRSKRSRSSHRSFTLPGEPVQLGDDDGLYLAALHHREQPGHAGPVQALGRLTAFDDDVAQVGALHQRHGPNLFRLRFGVIPRSACLSVETRT